MLDNFRSDEEKTKRSSYVVLTEEYRKIHERMIVSKIGNLNEDGDRKNTLFSKQNIKLPK